MNKIQAPAARLAFISISDRAHQNVYADQGIPALTDWFSEHLITAYTTETVLLPDEQAQIENTLINLCDQQKVDLIITTGGTGPAKRDVTVDATLNIADKILPGFGEQMRQLSLQYVPTAILSRQEAVIRKHSLIVNLPGQPKAIRQILDGIFPAIPYCLDLIEASYIDTDPNKLKCFRPLAHKSKS